jgi:hypothetical protein
VGSSLTELGEKSEVEQQARQAFESEHVKWAHLDQYSGQENGIFWNDGWNRKVLGVTLMAY